MPGVTVAALLLANGLLVPEQIEQVERLLQEKRCSFEEAVLELQLVSKTELLGTIADQLRVPYVDLKEYTADPAVFGLIPTDLLRRYRALPLFRIRRVLVVAMADPSDLAAIDSLRQAAGVGIEAYLSSEAEILQAIDQTRGVHGEAGRTMEDLVSRIQTAGTKPTAQEVGEESPIAKLVNLVLTQAIRDRASDVHIEPEERTLRIRYRIDGLLNEVLSIPKATESALVSRLKVMADLDIAENRVPQDGHFQMEMDRRRVDIRISTLPTVYGENVVLRILDSSGISLGLKRLGLSSTAMKKFEAAILRPYGIILCCGPTGSGKTTALYSALLRISSPDRNIVTIEDPVEYRLALIRQVQVNMKAGVSFATGLRSILRQDPDVIMVGEIRDLETAEIAIQAALTGHLVLSTLHTNDAPSTVIRLINMGIEPFLISASVICIISQRLLRTICEACKTWYEPHKALLSRLGIPEIPGQPVKMAKGSGCPQCKATGYRGRTGIFEIMVMDEELCDMVLTGASVSVLRETARKKGMKLLWEEGIAKALEGVTTLEEVSRLTAEAAKLPILASEKTGS